MELQFVIRAAKKGRERSQEGLLGNLNGGKEQPFESGLGKGLKAESLAGCEN